MNKSKRLLSLLLCLAFLLPFAPAALAGEPEGEEESGMIEPAAPEGTASWTPVEPESLPAPMEQESSIVVSGNCGDQLAWTLDSDGVLTVCGSGIITESPWLDQYRQAICSVILDEGVTGISDYDGFSFCQNLTKVELPDTLENIGIFAFFNCPQLTEVSFPSGLRSIGESAFQECGIGTVTIPASVDYLGEGAFGRCPLETILVQEGNTAYKAVDNVLFSENGTTLLHYARLNRADTYTVPAGVTAIGRESFYGNKNLSSVIFPEGLKAIGLCAFAECSSLDTIVFTGSAAECFSPRAFNQEVFTAFYPANDGTWTEDVLQDYGGIITWTAYDSPLILLQPESVTVGEGKKAEFSVFPVGKGLSYQWQWSRDGGTTWNNSSSATAGYNTATLSVSASASHNGYQYRCKVSNSAGSVTSEASTLTVSAKPTITAQPQDVTAELGETATFTVGASGTGLSYQWQWRKTTAGTWSNSSPATAGYNAATLCVNASVSRNGYQYRCVVSNSAGSVVSSIATLTVSAEKPVITAQPQDACASVGDTAGFTVAASGTGLSYRWQWSKDGGTTWNNSSSATAGYDTAVLSVSASASRNGYQYRCRVSNSAGSVFSEAAALTVIVKPTIITQPQDVTAVPGETATFTVGSSGAGLSYQWQWRKSASGTWSNSSSATAGYNTATLSVSVSASRNGYQYRCKVSNSAGSVFSQTVTLTVSAKPTITIQPHDVTAELGETATFTIGASGEGLSCQWQWRRSASGTWNNSSSATAGYNTASLRVTATEARNGYQYRCKVSNSAGNVFSQAATLTVKITTTYRALLIGEVSFDGDICNRNRNDVDRMQNVLTEIHGPKGGSYETTCLYDLTAAEVQAAIQNTFVEADDHDVSLFFIASHGVTNVSSGYWAGAIATCDNDLIPLPDLAEWLNAVPGEVIVILDSCGSGAAIYPDVTGRETIPAFDTDAFNECVIEAFAARDTLTNEYLPNMGEFRSSKFYVLTAAQHMESGIGFEGNGASNLFAAVLAEGVSGRMPADADNNRIVTLSELYRYIESDETVQYFQTQGYQHTQVYPENSPYALFVKD